VNLFDFVRKIFTAKSKQNARQTHHHLKKVKDLIKSPKQINFKFAITTTRSCETCIVQNLAPLVSFAL